MNILKCQRPGWWEGLWNAPLQAYHQVTWPAGEGWKTSSSEHRRRAGEHWRFSWEQSPRCTKPAELAGHIHLWVIRTVLRDSSYSYWHPESVQLTLLFHRVEQSWLSWLDLHGLKWELRHLAHMQTSQSKSFAFPKLSTSWIPTVVSEIRTIIHVFLKMNAFSISYWSTVKADFCKIDILKEGR